MRRHRSVLLPIFLLLSSCSSLPADMDATPASSTNISMVEETRAAPSATARASATPEPTATITRTPTVTANPEDLDDVRGCYEVAAELMVDANTAVWLGRKHWGSNPTAAGLQEIYRFLASRESRHNRLANGEDTRVLSAFCMENGAFRFFLSLTQEIQSVNYGGGISRIEIGEDIDTGLIERWAGHFRYLLTHEFGLSSEAIDVFEAPLWDEAQRLWSTPRLRVSIPDPPASVTPTEEPGGERHTVGSGRSFYLREGPDYTYPAFDVLIDDGWIEMTGQYGRCRWLRVTSGALSGWISNRDGIVLDRDACSLPYGTFRPFTGTFFHDGRLLVTGFQEGPGELILENNASDDAITVLTREDGETYISFYVRGGESYTLREIPDGNYTLYVSTGREWNQGNGMFTAQAVFFQFDDPLHYASSGVRWTVELQAVEEGNARTTSISAADFPQ